TGPVGQGPRTGRSLGLCSGYDSPGFTKGFGMGMGRGFGSGRGSGRGFGRGFGQGQGFARGRGPGHGMGRMSWNSDSVNPWPQSMSREDEIAMLKSQAEALNLSQADIARRIDELEKPAK
ncbi:MAG: DUF5320 domain-containing protein, partial [Bacteroidales bacterium]